MIGHYLSIALRNFRRRTGTTVSKVVALSLGLGCFIGAYTVSDYFERYDARWANAGRIVAITEDVKTPGASIGVPDNLFVSAPVAKYLKADFPQIPAVARLMKMGMTTVRGGDKTSGRVVYGVDADFLKIFDLPFIAGDPLKALSAPKSVVLTEEAAKSIFGTTDVVGRPLHIGKSEDVTVTGVISEIPPPSHLGKGLMSGPFELLGSMDVIDDLMLESYPPSAPKTRFSDMDALSSNLYSTYVLLPKDGSFTRADLDRGLRGFGARHFPKVMGEADFGTAPLSRFTKAAIDGIYLGNRFGVSFTTILYLFGMLVLGVACLDFANLATAEAAARAKEIGMRKTLGATRRQICVQTMIEVGLLAALSLAVALIVVAVAISGFNHPTDVGMRMPGLGRMDFWAGIAALLVAVTVVAGGYPALVLARVRPVFAIRMGTMRGGSRLLRAILIGAQFAATSFLVVAVAVIYIQNARMRSVGLDRTADPVLNIQTNLTSAKIDPATFRTEILALPGVKSYTTANISPYDVTITSVVFTPSLDPMAKQVTVNPHSIFYDFFKTTGVRLLAGRGYDETLDPMPVEEADRSDDAATSAADDKTPDKPGKIIIDRSTAAAFGWSPAQAVGKTIYSRTISNGPGETKIERNPTTIIGVAEDASLQITRVGPPLLVYYLTRQATYPIIQISKDDVSGTVARIDGLWKKLAPDVPIRHRFMDEAFNAAFAMFTTLSRAASGLALFAIVISCMGLIGMASHMIGRRRHEIGVRKTLGATTAQVLRLILWDLSKPVIVANLIAWPLAYMAAEIYLGLFTTQMAITPAPFVASFIVTLAVAWVAVGAQAFRAARVKPALVLRYE